MFFATSAALLSPPPQPVVDELQSSGVAVVDSGALCVFVEGSQVPLMVQKSDGGYGYASTDMAAIKQRVFDEKADWIIYVTDMGQVRGVHLLVIAQGRQTCRRGECTHDRVCLEAVLQGCC